MTDQLHDDDAQAVDSEIQRAFGRPGLAGERSMSRWYGVILTTHRVWVAIEDEAATTLTSLKVTSVEWTQVKRHRRLIYLLIAGVMAILGMLALLIQHSKTPGIMALVVAVASAAGYWLKSKVLLEIGAGRGTIAVEVAGGKSELQKAANFLSEVEQAACGTCKS